MIPVALHRFCRDAHLLGRYAPPGESGRPGGREWERAVSRGLSASGLARRQHAGTLGLFGCHGHSGAQHELDGAGHAAELGIWIEAKARASLDKGDVGSFALKTLDLYRGSAAHCPTATGTASWWPVLVSSESVNESIRRTCLSMGVTLCDPARLPLPTLLRVADRPAADMHLSPQLLSELVRLGERACRAVQARWPIDPERRTISMALDEPGATEIGDLLFVQDTLSDQLTDYFETHRPGDLERRGAALGDRLIACALAW